MPVVKSKSVTTKQKAAAAAPKDKGEAQEKPKEKPKEKKHLRDSQVRILRVLSESIEPATKKQMIEQGPVAESDMTKYLGSEDPIVRERNDKAKFPCLITLGYVKSVREGKDGPVKGYVITPAGKKALDKMKANAKSNAD